MARFERETRRERGAASAAPPSPVVDDVPEVAASFRCVEHYNGAFSAMPGQVLELSHAQVGCLMERGWLGRLFEPLNAPAKKMVADSLNPGNRVGADKAVR